MRLELLIEALAKELKLEAVPQKDKHSFFQVKINLEQTVAIKELEEGAYMTAKILPIPKEGGKEALYIYLMKANLLGQGTGGGALGIDQTEKYFTLSLTLPYELDYKTFHDTLEDFLNYIDYWKEEIPNYTQSLL